MTESSEKEFRPRIQCPIDGILLYANSDKQAVAIYVTHLKLAHSMNPEDLRGKKNEHSR